MTRYIIHVEHLCTLYLQSKHYLPKLQEERVFIQMQFYGVQDFLI